MNHRDEPQSQSATDGAASWLNDLRRDVPYALRSLLRTPAFTVLCVLTIAVGIGANAAIFSVVHAVLLRQLPYMESDRLVRVYESMKDQVGWTGSVSVPNLKDWREQSRTIDGFIAYQAAEQILDDGTSPERLLGIAASTNMFSVLGVRAMLGRSFVANEDQPGNNQVVVLSEALWRRRFGGDSLVIGRRLSLNGLPFTVIGVMSRNFQFPANNTQYELWVPYTPSQAATTERGDHFLSVLARLHSGAMFDASFKEMKEIAARGETLYPNEQTNRTVLMMPLQDTQGGRFRAALYVLLGAVTLVLLIACANVANLLLARAAGRRRDVAVRLALGASRSQLIRQYLTESILLAATGALIGSIFAALALKPLTVLSANALPLAAPITLNGQVFAVLVVVSVVCGIVFGLVPALQSAGAEMREDLVGAGGKTTGGKAQHRTRSSLVVAQIALSLMLLVGAGLMMRAFVRLRGTDAGFNAERLITMRLAVPKQMSDSVLAQQVYGPVLERVRALSGVTSAGMINMLPIDSWGVNGDFWLTNKPKPVPGKVPVTELRQVTPGYFATMGIPIMAGRDFAEQDRSNGANPILVNEAMVRKYFAGQNPIGQSIRRGDDDDDRFTIVGVVGDVRSGGLDREPAPETYFPYTNPNRRYGNLILVVRSAAPIEGLVASLRAAVHDANPSVPVFAVRSMDEIVGRSLASRQLNLTLLAIFALIALLLAASGLYGVISYLVAQRTREFGIRMALGADRARVVRLVLRQGGLLTLLGIGAGLGGALALSRVLEAMLYGVGSRDPATFAAVSLLLAAVALLATIVPAWRASRVNPMTAIRSD